MCAFNEDTEHHKKKSTNSQFYLWIKLSVQWLCEHAYNAALTAF